MIDLANCYIPEKSKIEIYQEDNSISKYNFTLGWYLIYAYNNQSKYIELLENIKFPDLKKVEVVFPAND